MRVVVGRALGLSWWGGAGETLWAMGKVSSGTKSLIVILSLVLALSYGTLLVYKSIMAKRGQPVPAAEAPASPAEG